MQGRKCFVTASLFILFLGACASEKTHKADCYDCITENQSWQKFDWTDLEGSWRGSQESVINEYSATGKKREEQVSQLQFQSGEKFLATQNVKDCGAFPKNAIVVNRSLWKEKEQEPATIYEVFGQVEEDKVSYGRATLSFVNGGAVCSYEKMGSVMGMNRLALPSVQFSERLTPDGRLLASGPSSEFQLRFEFLRFEPQEIRSQSFLKDARKPAAVAEQDNPPLIFRVFKIVNKVKSPYDQGEWVSTEEHIYRLWRVQ